MSKEAVQQSLSVVGIVGGLGALLPDLDKSWEASPSDGDHAERLRYGQLSYLGLAVFLGAVASYGAGSMTPLILTVAVAGFMVALHEGAFRHT